MSSVAASRLTAHRSPATRCRQLLLGPPLATSRLVAERLRKVVALAVFSSDAISSTAYGTEQIMPVLVAAGAVATGLALPIALGIGALLAILILSYRQTITAYPSSGGAYVVSRDNFGPRWALVAGSALLIDYVLTVAVSVTSGVAALTTAVPPLQRLVLPLSLAAIGLITWTNLRRVRESGRIFAVPTYLFVGSCAVMLRVGLARLAAGCTALTGVEAISNGVPAFRPPEARNARRTLAAMGAILGSLFIGVSFLAVRAGMPLAVPLEVVHCPNRDLVDCGTDAVAGRARPDTEVTVLLPRHGDQSGFRRLLHDQTGRNLLAALNRLDGVKVAVVHPPAHHPVVP